MGLKTLRLACILAATVIPAYSFLVQDKNELALASFLIGLAWAAPDLASGGRMRRLWALLRRSIEGSKLMS